MGYSQWACEGHLIPATIENATKLNITINPPKDVYPDEEIQDWWDDVLRDMGIKNAEIKGSIDGRLFTGQVYYINEEADCDDNMDSEVSTYFCFMHEDLFTPTPLYASLIDAGMKYCTWVESV